MNKYIIILVGILLLSSCSEENVYKLDTTPVLKISETQPNIPLKYQFNKDIDYIVKVKLENTFSLSDTVVIESFFYNGNDTLFVNFFDDGGLNSESVDLVAKNNIWTAKVNSLGFEDIGEYEFEIIAFVANSIQDSQIWNVSVRENARPQLNSITGMAENDSLKLGFSDVLINADVSDDDNDINGENDSQILYMDIFNSENEILNQKTYTRDDNFEDFVIKNDSTYNAGIPTGMYKLSFYGKDFFDAFSDTLEFSNIYIKNTPPSIKTLTYPDTITIPEEQGTYSFSVKALLNDKQGNLQTQDIDSVSMILTVNDTQIPYTLFDDGDVANSGDEVLNDGIYTISFQFTNENQVAEYPFVIKAIDKVGNVSEEINGKLIFVKTN